MKQHEPFYIFFYVFECPTCETPTPWPVMTIHGIPDELDMHLKCPGCDKRFTVKPSQAVCSHAVVYQDKKCSPFRT